jgi:glycosyltransferase involved in cell wall biosynthesis
MHKISIIVPVYNVEKYLKTCIESILSQTYKNFELILVNDGSTDNSGKICDSFSLNDNRVKVIHKSNGGLSDARNAGLELANGDFIGFVDSDDYIDDHMYEELLNNIILFKSDIAVCGRYDLYEDIKIRKFYINKPIILNNKEVIKKLLTWNNIDSAAWDKLYNRKVFKNIRFPVNKYNEDIFVMVEILSKIDKIVLIGKPLYYYRHRPNSITSESFSIRKLDLLDATTSVLSIVKDKYPDLLPRAISFHLKGIVFLLGLFKSNQIIKSYNYQYKMLKILLKNHIIQIITNQFIGLKIKTKSLLLYFNIYIHVYSFFKNFKKNQK